MSVKDYLFKTEQGDYVYTQKPNWPVIVWFVGVVLARLISSAELSAVVQSAASVSLLYWAWLEITQGANRYRRILGAVILVLSAVSLLRLISE